MTAEDRLQVLEAEINMTIAFLSAVRAAVIGLTFELAERQPDMPGRLARAMMDCDAPAIREAGGHRAELNAIETERLAEAIQGMAR